MISIEPELNKNPKDCNSKRKRSVTECCEIRLITSKCDFESTQQLVHHNCTGHKVHEHNLNAVDEEDFDTENLPLLFSSFSDNESDILEPDLNTRVAEDNDVLLSRYSKIKNSASCRNTFEHSAYHSNREEISSSGFYYHRKPQLFEKSLEKLGNKSIEANRSPLIKELCDSANSTENVCFSVSTVDEIQQRHPSAGHSIDSTCQSNSFLEGDSATHKKKKTDNIKEFTSCEFNDRSRTLLNYAGYMDTNKNADNEAKSLKEKLENFPVEKLRAIAESYGFKSSDSKATLIKIVESCLDAIDSRSQSKKLGKETPHDYLITSTKTVLEFDDIVTQTHRAISQVVKQAKDNSVWIKILTYSAIDVEEFQLWLKRKNLNVSLDLIKSWCDKYGVLMKGSWH